MHKYIMLKGLSWLDFNLSFLSSNDKLILKVFSAKGSVSWKKAAEHLLYLTECK